MSSSKSSRRNKLFTILKFHTGKYTCKCKYLSLYYKVNFYYRNSCLCTKCTMAPSQNIISPFIEIYFVLLLLYWSCCQNQYMWNDYEITLTKEWRKRQSSYRRVNDICKDLVLITYYQYRACFCNIQVDKWGH